MGEYAVGQPVPRSEDPRLIKGGGRFVDDVVLAGMVFGHVLRSPHANAKIRAIDTAQALAAPGVLAVLTHDDWKASGFGDLPNAKGRKRRDGSDMYVTPIPALVANRVRRVGDYVAFVVAETLNQAIDAAELVTVDYEVLPAVTGTMDAAKPGAALVWDDCPDNICFVQQIGDKEATDEAFAKADHVVGHTFVINRVTASTIEPRGCVGDYDRADDHYTLYTTLQGALPYRSNLATRILKVPESKVRVVAGDVGGSFGMKSQLYAEGPLVLLASKTVGRPVKWTSNRTEAFLSDAHGRDQVADVELALDKEGTFLGLRAKITANLGAYATSSTPNPAVGNIGGIAGVYTTPSIHVDVTGVFTNTNFTCPYRGAGRPEAAFMIERIVDLAADELGIDPAELRRRNIITPDAMPFKTGLVFKFDCGEFEKNMDMALAMANYGNFKSRRDEAAKRGKLRGIGFSNTIEKAASPGVEGAEVRFDRSGTATILAGSINCGQSHETIYKQIVCGRLGLDPDEVQYIWGDTDKVSFGHGTGGSRSATMGGSAVFLATEKIVTKAKRIAAHLMEVPADDVAIEDGVFAAKGSNRTMTIKDIAKEAVKPASLPDGMEPGLISTAVHVSKANNFPNGCHVCELEIDQDTGVVEIVDYNVVIDAGRVLNPNTLAGQIQGGVAQGAGQILLEDIRFDENSGQLISGSFLDYAMPRADDLSAIQVQSNPVPPSTNPLGVKGVGEAGNVSALPAVANAVVDALSPLGIRHIGMPATPERIWRAMAKAQNKTQNKTKTTA